MKNKIFLLICFSLLFQHSLQAEIYQITLAFQGMCCEFCPKNISDHIKKVPGVQDVTVFPREDMVLVEWNQMTPFNSAIFSKIFYNHTLFKLLQVEVEVEGTFDKKKGDTVLRSLPDNSFFYIENANTFSLGRYPEDKLIRLKGVVHNQQGFNFMMVTDVLPAIGEEPEDPK